MSADCRAAGDQPAPRARGPRRPSPAPPSLDYDDYPREVAKRDIAVSEAAARLANALHLHLD